MKPPKVLSRGTEFGSTCVGAVVLFLQLILHTESGILPLIRAASPQSWRSVGGSSCSLHTPRSQLFTTAFLILRAHWHKGHLPTCSPSTFIITVIISSTHLSASFKQFLTGDIYHWGAAFPRSNWPPATLIYSWPCPQLSPLTAGQSCHAEPFLIMKASFTTSLVAGSLWTGRHKRAAAPQSSGHEAISIRQVNQTSTSCMFALL